jgi:PAS domain S-box-containing protein
MSDATHEHVILSQALRDVLHTMTSALNPEDVMHRILENVGKVVPHEAANIMLIEGNQAVVRFTSGYQTAIDEQIKAIRLPLTLSNLNQIYTTGKTCLIHDVNDYDNWQNVPGVEWIQSTIGVPIRARGQVIGILNVDSGTRDYFTPTHVAQLEAFADFAAVAIESAQVYQALTDNATELALLNRATNILLTNLSTAQDLRTLSHQIVQTAIEAFGTVDCGIMLARPETGTFDRLARAGQYNVNTKILLHLDGPGLAPEAYRTGKVVYSPDVRADPRYIANVPMTRSELVIPLQTGSKVIGVMDLQSTEPDAFNARDQRVLKAFAERAATAIENIQLYEAAKLYADKLEENVKERTAQLNRARERAETILNGSSDAIVLANAGANIRQTNPAFDALFYYGVDEAFNKSIEILVDDNYKRKLTTLINSTIKDSTISRAEVVAIRKDGTTFVADVGLAVIADSERDRLGLIFSFRDITKQKQVEESLRLALERERELGELKSRFVSMASHEFRTPLATILSSSELIKSYWDRMERADINAKLDQIHEQVRHMTTLLEDVLTLGRSEIGKTEFNPEPIEILTFCQDTINQIRQAISASHPLEFSSSGLCDTINIDKTLLRQILTNLISNAIKYSPNNKSVHVELTCDEVDIIIRVRDEGIGIPEKDQDHLFEAFHRAANVGTISGTGLGLVIIKRQVELYGGAITFKSQVGVGTTFIVTLPR